MPLSRPHQFNSGGWWRRRWLAWLLPVLLALPALLALAGTEGSGVLPQSFEELNDPTQKPADKSVGNSADRPVAAPTAPADPAFHPIAPTSPPALLPPPERAYENSQQPAPPTALWLEVEVNGQAQGIALLLRDADAHLWARGAEFAAWRLALPKAEPQHSDGDTFFPLDALPGIEYRVDEASQTLVVRAPAKLFAMTEIDQATHHHARPDRVPLGAFFNYDVIAEHDGGGSPSGLSGEFELGTFSRYGTVGSTFVRNDAIGGDHLIRLDSTWTADRPDELATLRVGDSISRASSWGGAVHFAGIQWSTDFTTQPGFVSTPLAGLRGEAELPSTVDLYLNGATRLHTDIAPGPFSITNLPLISGQGQAELVVTNVLGQQQVLTVPYYASPQLLRPGLSSFSYEVGVARDNYGLDSNDYGRSLGIATYRRGLYESVTGEIHGEVLREQQNLGVGGVWLAHGIGVLSAGVAASHTPQGGGELLQVGFERQWSNFSLGGSARFTTEKYTEVGTLPATQAPVRLLQGFASLQLARRGTLSFNYIQQDYRGQMPVRLLSANAGWPVTRSSLLTLSLLKPTSGPAAPTIGINLVYTLGARTSVTASAVRNNGYENQDQVQLQQNLPAGRGFGYQVDVSAQSTAPSGGALEYQSDVGTYTVRAARINDDTGVSAEAQGGVVLLGDEPHLTRRVDQSFAVVQVGNYPNVHIYADNQEVAETNSHGVALVPRIRAFEANPLRIEQADLPLDATVDTYEKDVVPARRSGLRVAFDVKPSAGAIVTLVTADGAPVPTGAVARLAGSDLEFPVGMHGEVYLTGLEAASRVSVSWPGQSCQATVRFLRTDDPLPTLGPYVCGMGQP